MPLTLEDIARMSGVSRSTVSRVINNDPNVKETTRLKSLGNYPYDQFPTKPGGAQSGSRANSGIGIGDPHGGYFNFCGPIFPAVDPGYFLGLQFERIFDDAVAGRAGL